MQLLVLHYTEGFLYCLAHPYWYKWSVLMNRNT